MATTSPRLIFVSFPVADIPRARAFYQALGFTPDPSMGDDTAAAFTWSETIRIMAISRERWADFTTRQIPPADQSEFGHGITCDSREEVDRLTTAAAAVGGQLDVNPIEDHGFMYQRDIADADGHIWGLMWMDPNAAPAA